MLDINIFDIDLIVYYAKFEMLYTEVKYLQSNNLLFNPKIVILRMSLTIVQYNTILAKKVHNYFEVMINYIIAQTSHVRRNNVSLLFCILANFLFHRWYFLCHKFILDWLFVHSHSWTQTLCTKKGVPHSHLPQFSSCCDDSPQFSSIKAGRQQMWVRWQEFFHDLHLTELSSSSLLNHIASPENLPCGYCVPTPVRHFDQQLL